LKAEASQRELQAVQREKEARAEAKAEEFQREKQIRKEMEQEARRTVQLREKELELTAYVGNWQRRKSENASRKRVQRTTRSEHLLP